MKVLFLLYQSPNSEELRDFENMWNLLKKRSGVALGTIGRKKISYTLNLYYTYLTFTISPLSYLIHNRFAFLIVQSTSERYREAPAGDRGLPPTAQFARDAAQGPVKEGPKPQPEVQADRAHPPGRRGPREEAGGPQQGPRQVPRYSILFCHWRKWQDIFQMDKF